jgi:hypothetical protein
MHDSPHRSEQADVGRHRADRGEERQVRLDRVELALEARPHRPARAVEERAGVHDALLAQLEELAHAGREDALHRRLADVPGRVGVEVVEVAAGPELALELVVRRLGAAQAESLPKMTVQLASDAIMSPAITICTTMLACSTSVTMEKSWFIDEGEADVVGDSAGAESSELDAADADRALGQQLAGRRASCAISRLAWPRWTTATLTSMTSSSRAGRRYRSAVSLTTKAMPASVRSASWPKPRLRSHSVRARSKNFR